MHTLLLSKYGQKWLQASTTILDYYYEKIRLLHLLETWAYNKD